MNTPASIGDAAASTTPTVRCTGGEALARSLAAHGCGPIFGMGGFQLLPMYDAIRRLGLRHVLVNDERAAAFAADAYARARFVGGHLVLYESVLTTRGPRYEARLTLELSA